MAPKSAGALHRSINQPMRRIMIVLCKIAKGSIDLKQGYNNTRQIISGSAMKTLKIVPSLATLLIITTALQPTSQAPMVGAQPQPLPTDHLEVLAIVTKVIDGDTFDAKVIAVYKDRYLEMNGSTIRVRLADINAPELGTPRGEASRSALRSLLDGVGVYLDIDDLYVYDRYDRVVAIAYLKINTTHALNVNLWLVMNSYASIVDHPNEFKPHLWSLYIAYAPGITTPTTITTTESARPGGGYEYPAILITILIIATTIALLLKLRGR